MQVLKHQKLNLGVTTMTKHTPGPWKVVYGNKARKFHEASIRPVKSPIKGLILPIASVKIYRGLIDDNAAHIVRCVNAHDDLLLALKNMLDLRDAVMRSECLPDRPEVEVIRSARAAIAKATL
jgi:hypothetical protein